MPASIGVNLRVTGHCSQGGRKYMEDLFSVAYQQTEDERDLEYAFFGIYDGHGGSEAAAFAKEHLMDSIVKQRQFWSDNDEDVLKAIRNGYMLTHLNMWKELEKWPKTVTGLPSTAGTTASVAFIRRGKIYIGHVGDSAIILGYQKEGSDEWAAKPLTLDHKPESTVEMERIQRSGGKVISKAGVPRVVWNRPRAGHKGPIKKNTPMDEIPFLAVARSLGDLWSYNTQNDEFIVSPDPDVGVLTIDPSKFRCLIFGTDGLWNMLSPEAAVGLVQATERHNEAALVANSGGQPRDWLNPSKSLVDHALERWSNTRMRADNTSVVTLMLDPPGPPRAAVLRARTAPRTAPRAAPRAAPPAEPTPQNGLTIVTRYSDADRAPSVPDAPEKTSPLPPCATLDGRFTLPPPREDEPDPMTNYGNPAESLFMARVLNRSHVVNTLSAVFDEIVKTEVSSEVREPSPPLTALPADEPPPPSPAAAPSPTASRETEDGGIQINEVSSSSPTEAPTSAAVTRRGARGGGGGGAGRVLRSHDASPPPRAARDRLVILTRSKPAVPSAAHARLTRSRDPAASRAAPPPAAVVVPRLDPPAKPQSGNCVRAGGRRPGPPPDCSKENCGRRRRHVAPVPPPRPRPRPRDSPEVHSTTGECAARPAPAPAPAAAPRALRPRNPPDEPPAGKRPRLPPRRTPPSAAADTWGPALSLRNRLRKRLLK